MEYKDFKKEVKHVADKCGVTEEELRNIFFQLKYGGGKLSKEDGNRITNIMKK